MYRVVWTSIAKDHLWSVWTQSSDELNLSVVAAMRRADSILSAHPHDAGESRDRGRRVLMVDPATFVFRVLEAEQLVRILSVRVWRRQ